MKVKPSAVRGGELEREVVGEGLHVDRRGPERTGGFVLRGGVGELQAGAVELGVTVELHARGVEAGAEVDCAGGTARVDGDNGLRDGAGAEAGFGGDGAHSGGGVDDEGRGVFASSSGRGRAIDRVEDSGAGIGDGDGLCGRVGAGAPE